MIVMSGAAQAVFARASAVLSGLWLAVTAGSGLADVTRDPVWSHNGYVGLMTEDKVEDLANGPEFTNQKLIGYALSYDRPLNDFWSIGFEVQATYHFDDQTYGEFGLPLTVRYRPQRPWFDPLEAFAFGLGLSTTTEVPEIEIETRGDSRRTLIYWMLEAEFETAEPDVSLFFRIHHRSDAWGTLKPEGGSNALAIGLRKDF